MTKEMKQTKCYFDKSQDTLKRGWEGQDGTTACTEIAKNDGDLCHGCKKLICDNHSINSSLMGSHDPMEHLEQEDEGDEE